MWFLASIYDTEQGVPKMGDFEMRAAIVCVVFASILLVAMMALAEPTVTIDTDSSSYEPGDTIEVTFAAENPDGCTTLDVCVGLLTPEGGIYTMGPNGWGASIVPWIADFRMPPHFDMTAHLFFELPSMAPMPPISEDGSYNFASLLMYPRTWTWASNLSLAPFTYTGEGPTVLLSEDFDS